ncbi:hypothetical protein ACFOJE_20805 [Azotobacter bryophylli]|uniref:Lipoprotein n=1 Tax=Azotobacter bryophylli TaxID=1986537 RepID=A0ABV7B168_9GAMM
MTKKQFFFCLAPLAILQSCTSTPAETDPVNIALKSCGMGLSTQTTYIFKTAFAVANKKGGVEFSNTMNNSVDMQESALLKQLSDKSAESTKAILAEIKDVRECVIMQSAQLRPASRTELLERCREDLQQRISPRGNISYGTLRLWTQQRDDPRYKKDMPVMAGHFDNGGAGFAVKAQCDIRGGTLQEVIDLNPYE